jgi:hypothetical protein
VLATGSSGGLVIGKAGDGGYGAAKGLPGGDVAPAGDGGDGGMITIGAGGTLKLVGSVRFAAEAGDGGNQFGVGGKGGDSKDLGGNGGDVDKAGNGGIGGTIKIDYTTLVPASSPIKATVKRGAGGVQMGMPGVGGTGKDKESHGKEGTRGPSGLPGEKDGTVIINGEVQ